MNGIPWVDVSVALPDDDLAVLVYVTNANHYFAYIEDGGWKNLENDQPLDGVTHWADLDEPPEPVGKLEKVAALLRPGVEVGPIRTLVFEVEVGEGGAA